MNTLINFDLLRATCLEQEPFEWARHTAIFREASVAAELAATFPESGYTHYTRHSTAKNYDTHGRFLVKMGHGEVFQKESLPDIWCQFAQELLSEDYLQAVSQATQQFLGDTHMEAVFWRLPKGSTIDPHTDSPLKKVTHLFYFNDTWPSGSAGCLRILRSWRLDDVAYEHPPLTNSSILFNRSGRSWHGYLPVEGECVRKAIQVSFCTCAATK